MLNWPLKGKHAIGDWQVSIFQNDIDDMINWAANS